MCTFQVSGTLAQEVPFLTLGFYSLGGRQKPDPGVFSHPHNPLPRPSTLKTYLSIGLSNHSSNAFLERG